MINYTRYGVYAESFQINLRNDYDLEEKIHELEKILDFYTNVLTNLNKMKGELK